MKKMEALKFSAEQTAELSKQLGVQEVKKGTPASTDPINFPVWQIPNPIHNVFVYVPNHTVQNEDGVLQLREDRALQHSITVGKKYYTYRCVSGLKIDGIYDGTCPLCEGAREPWDLANKKIKAQCEAQGLDPDDTQNKAVSSIRSSEFSNRALKDAEVRHTFPIVVFETKDNDGKTLLKDDEGNYIYQVYWYSCSDSIWEKKWMECLKEANERAENEAEDSESVEELTHIGGNFFLLKYIYTPKDGKSMNVRDAAKEVTINIRKMKNSEKVRAALDKLTEGWTPEKSQEVVLANQFHSVSDLEEVADEALENTRKLLALYDAGGVANNNALPNNATGGFQLSKPPVEDKGETVAEDGAAPIETDMDIE